MKRKILFLIVALIALTFFTKYSQKQSDKKVLSLQSQSAYWFLLHRKSNIEYLYSGTPGEPKKSTLVKAFLVKTGIPGERPTPLPHLVDREYWLITQKMETKENPETAPYFLTLDVPVTSIEPYGPRPYHECNGQCNWVLPGSFGLHGIAGNPHKLDKYDPGSSGCVRHSDEDITYLYNLLDPHRQEIRYYVADI